MQRALRAIASRLRMVDLIGSVAVVSLLAKNVPLQLPKLQPLAKQKPQELPKLKLDLPKLK